MRTPKRPMLEAGEAAPSFELKDTEGRTHTLGDLTNGRPALFMLFKIGCPVCQMTAPYLDRLGASTTVQVVGISQDDAASTKAFQGRFGLTVPTLLDESRAGYPASNGFGISSVPSIFLVESDGTVSTAFAGFSKQDFEALGRRMGVEPFRPGEKVPDFRAG